MINFNYIFITTIIIITIINIILIFIIIDFVQNQSFLCFYVPLIK